MPEAAAAATCHTLSHLSPEISHLIFFFFVSHFAITTAPDVTADGISGLRCCCYTWSNSNNLKSFWDQELPDDKCLQPDR